MGVMSTPAQYLISAILRTGDLQTALDKGVTVDVISFGPEWSRSPATIGTMATRQTRRG